MTSRPYRALRTLISGLKVPQPTEHQIQVSVIQWWNYACHGWRLPAFALHAIPNAGAGAQRGQAGKMKAEGTRAGIPDLFLAVPVGRAGGLYIEMKRAVGGKVSPEQRAVMNYLMKAGYVVAVCRSLDEARETITRYLRAYVVPTS